MRLTPACSNVATKRSATFLIAMQISRGFSISAVHLKPALLFDSLPRVWQNGCYALFDAVNWSEALFWLYEPPLARAVPGKWLRWCGSALDLSAGRTVRHRLFGWRGEFRISQVLPYES